MTPAFQPSNFIVRDFLYGGYVLVRPKYQTGFSRQNCRLNAGTGYITKSPLLALVI